MLIKVCPLCNGDGFGISPPRRSTTATTLPKPPSSTPTVRARPPCGRDRAERVELVAYEFQCAMCQGLGEFEWRRGKTLAPLAGSRS